MKGTDGATTNSGTYMVGLDVGTTKVAAVVGEQTASGVDIIGLGTAPSRGLRRGTVVNLESTVDAIKKAKEEVELMAGVEVHRALVSIGGTQLKGFNSRGVIAIQAAGRVVNEESVARVIEAARAVSIPQDRQVLHVLPQEYMIDEQDGIKHPYGMSGTRLEVNVHMATGAQAATQNLLTCVGRAGIEVADLVVEQLASAESVLSEDEKELGVALVDVGGGSTDLAIYEKGAVWHTAVLPLGGDHFTNDIAVGLRTPIPEAERIKRRNGAATTALVGADEMVEVPGVGGRAPREVSRQVLAAIIEPRAEELFQLLKEEIARAGYDKSLNSGIVLSGGGSLLEGMCDVAERVFDLPTRRGSPHGVGGLTDLVGSPLFATSVGLLLWGQRRDIPVMAQLRAEPVSLFERVGTGLKSWLQEFF